MRRRPLLTCATLLAFLLTLHVSRPAAADNLTGVVGELGVHMSSSWVYFRFTDPALTTGCKVGSPVPNDYLGFSLSEAGKALYAMLLASKKGATITCLDIYKPSCSLSRCVLP